MKLSQFTEKVGLSETGAMDEKVRERKRQGLEVFNFGVGQPDFPTPPDVCEAGITAIREGKTRYTSPTGLLELREAVADRFKAEQGLEFKSSEILVSGGAKHSIHNLLAAVVSPDEDVLLPTPAWVSYPSMIRLVGGNPVFVPTRLEDGFKLTADALRRAITPKSVGIILNTPGNPTGAVYSEDDIQAIVPVLRESGLWVITDEIYDRILFDGRRHRSLAAIAPDMRDRIAIVNGVSKSYAMTGWRIGYAAGPADWIRMAGAIQSHQAGNACSISQEATLYALRTPGESVETMRAEFQKRRDLVMEMLAGLHGCDLFRPEGTFYLLPRIAAYLGDRKSGPSLASDAEFVAWLFDSTGVATVAGGAFEAKGYVRISFAASEAALREGLTRMRRAMEEIGPAR